jgi:FlaG/FlaF family flagellin (archaellin)
MLMLVVTIIIAAVVSAYAGGLTKTSDSPPSVAMDVIIKNSGEWRGSYIQFDVKSVSDPFSSGDVKIVTAWSSASGYSGGNTTMKGLNAPNTRTGSTSYQSPLGYGSGVLNWTTSSPYPIEQQFGNYTLTTGTSMKSSAYGYNPTYGGYGVSTAYEYTTGSGYAAGNIDGMQAILGGSWYRLRAGDTVKVMVMHVPSGKVIYTKNVQVVE